MKIITIILCLLIYNVSINASGELSGFEFLRLDHNARSSAMSGALIAMGGDVNFIFHNPAGMAYTQERQFSFNYNNYLLDLNSGFVGFSQRYDKFGQILRIEVTCYDVSKINIFRDVQKRNGSIEKKVAPARKSIYSLYDLMFPFKNIIKRYLEFISSFDDPTNGIKKIDKVTEDVIENNRKFKGFNFFNKSDEEILLSIADGKYCVRGLANKDIRNRLISKTSNQVSRILKRLRLHGLIKKIRNSYRYHLTVLGKQVISAGLKFKNMSLIPELSKA